MTREMQLNRVVLPAPLGPTTARNVPGATSRLMPRSTGTSPKCLRTSRRDRTGTPLSGIPKR